MNSNKWKQISNRNRNKNKKSNYNNKHIPWSKHEENELIELTKDKTRIEINWNNILTKFPIRTVDAIKSKHYELFIAKNKKIKKVATRFSSRIAKYKNNNGY